MNNDDYSEQDESFDLNRFMTAQRGIYARVLKELRCGRKRSHWMWFILPQIKGLGNSALSQRYAIRSLAEAMAYLSHPVLGARLVDCANAILAVEGRSASDIFGYPDDLKLKSSMTLFAAISGETSVFIKVLSKFYDGKQDEKTITILKRL